VTQPKALGLGHAVWCARSVVGDEPFAVLLADDLVRHDGPGALRQMVEAWDATGAAQVGVEEVPREATRKYGIVGVEDDGQGRQAVRTIVEKPAPEDAPSTLGVVGRYILPPEIFGLLEDVRAGVGGEIQLTDAIAELVARRPVHALAFEGTRYDCGSRFGFVRATMDFALEHEDMRRGVLEHMAAAVRRHES
jgi:UTP--glucose-1-phosphate uridylyltransferase